MRRYFLEYLKETLIYSLEGRCPLKLPRQGALPVCRGMAEVKQCLGEHAPLAPCTPHTFLAALRLKNSKGVWGELFPPARFGAEPRINQCFLKNNFPVSFFQEYIA
jgi:hypothetical protein